MYVLYIYGAGGGGSLMISWLSPPLQETDFKVILFTLFILHFRDSFPIYMEIRGHVFIGRHFVYLASLKICALPNLNTHLVQRGNREVHNLDF